MGIRGNQSIQQSWQGEYRRYVEERQLGNELVWIWSIHELHGDGIGEWT